MSTTGQAELFKTSMSETTRTHTGVVCERREESKYLSLTPTLSGVDVVCPLKVHVLKACPQRGNPEDGGTFKR